MNPQAVRVSKFLGLVLRHQPEKIGLRLDEAGWVNVDELLAASESHGVSISRAELDEVVRDNDKQRFAFSEDRARIRASQGHSIEIALGYQAMTPPDVLYHGTADRFLNSIREQGLIKGKRHHVHLSADPGTALNVGQRHGKPIVLTVQSALMHNDGLLFYLSANGVWLTEHVPVQYLVFE